MISSRKRAYKHKAYVEIDHLKQKLVILQHQYNVMEAMVRKADGMLDEHKAVLRAAKVAMLDVEAVIFGKQVGFDHDGFKEAITKIEEALK